MYIRFIRISAKVFHSHFIIIRNLLNNIYDIYIYMRFIRISVKKVFFSMP